MRILRALPVRGRTLAALFATVVATTPIAACSDAPSKDQCERLLEHLIDIEIKAGGGDGEMTDEMKDDLAKQKKAVIDFAVGQKFIETCTVKTPKKGVECGLAAKSPADVAKCDEAK